MVSRLVLDDDDEEQPRQAKGVYYVIVTLESDKAQRELLEELIEEGYQCRALAL